MSYIADVAVTSSIYKIIFMSVKLALSRHPSICNRSDFTLHASKHLTGTRRMAHPPRLNSFLPLISVNHNRGHPAQKSNIHINLLILLNHTFKHMLIRQTDRLRIKKNSHGGPGGLENHPHALIYGNFCSDKNLNIYLTH